MKIAILAHARLTAASTALRRLALHRRRERGSATALPLYTLDAGIPYCTIRTASVPVIGIPSKVPPVTTPSADVQVR